MVDFSKHLARNKTMSTAQEKQEQVGSALIIFNGADHPVPFSGMLAINEGDDFSLGYTVNLWMAKEKADGSKSKLFANGSISHPGLDKKEKCGYISLMKAAEDKPYSLYGWIKLKVTAEGYDTSHMVYLRKNEGNGKVLYGGIVEFEQTDNTDFIPTKGASKAKTAPAENFDDIPF